MHQILKIQGPNSPKSAYSKQPPEGDWRMFIATKIWNTLKAISHSMCY